MPLGGFFICPSEHPSQAPGLSSSGAALGTLPFLPWAFAWSQTIDLRSTGERAWELGGAAASSSPTSVLVFHNEEEGDGLGVSPFKQKVHGLPLRWGCARRAGSFPLRMREMMRQGLLKDDGDNSMGLLSLGADGGHTMGDSSAEPLTWSSNSEFDVCPVRSECFLGVHLKTVR